MIGSVGRSSQAVALLDALRPLLGMRGGGAEFVHGQLRDQGNIDRTGGGGGGGPLRGGGEIEVVGTSSDRFLYCVQHRSCSDVGAAKIDVRARRRAPLGRLLRVRCN
jgi:hypothetical protein